MQTSSLPAPQPGARHLRFKVGDRVRWTSAAVGATVTKHGVVVEVVPANHAPTTMAINGRSRPYESYVVEVTHRFGGQGLIDPKNRSAAQQMYWPRTHHLEAV